MPEKRTQEYNQLVENPDKPFLKTITSQFQAVLDISLLKILSGQRETKHLTSNVKALDWRLFEKFDNKLAEIEKRIVIMNNDEKLSKATCMVQSSEGGRTGIGIPNSISI
ncbi:putative linoleate 9S-lipoxygenase [Medicago truncatula]|uniref:Putative linoleate 9S-lipoxygenase n=1 Tax=Medicago truncatula TaxID=3880 RepID=A0A396J1R4_MEDTR|nr:linoleate 9S-lipoxygenase 1 [Medicago truncatula]RHN70663.1 putative linoleate 9S-lipoxygenase [Medicago truncatula]